MDEEPTFERFNLFGSHGCDTLALALPIATFHLLYVQCSRIDASKVTNSNTWKKLQNGTDTQRKWLRIVFFSLRTRSISSRIHDMGSLVFPEEAFSHHFHSSADCCNVTEFRHELFRPCPNITKIRHQVCWIQPYRTRRWWTKLVHELCCCEFILMFLEMPDHATTSKITPG